MWNKYSVKYSNGKFDEVYSIMLIFFSGIVGWAMYREVSTEKGQGIKRSPPARLQSQAKNIIINVNWYPTHQLRCMSVSKINEETAKVVGGCVRTVKAIKQLTIGQALSHHITSKTSHTTFYLQKDGPVWKGGSQKRNYSLLW